MLTYHGGTTSNCRLSTLIKIVDRFGTHKFKFEVSVWINASRQNIFPSGVDCSSTTGNDEVPSDLFDDSIFNIDVVFCNSIFVYYFAMSNY